MFKVEFQTTNAAFKDGGTDELIRVLDSIKESVHNHIWNGTIRDSNGNRIGEWSWYAFTGEHNNDRT